MMAFGGGKWRSFPHRPTDRPRRPFYRSSALLPPASLQLFFASSSGDGSECITRNGWRRWAGKRTSWFFPARCDRVRRRRHLFFAAASAGQHGYFPLPLCRENGEGKKKRTGWKEWKREEEEEQVRDRGRVGGKKKFFHRGRTMEGGRLQWCCRGGGGGGGGPKPTSFFPSSPSSSSSSLSFGRCLRLDWTRRGEEGLAGEGAFFVGGKGMIQVSAQAPSLWCGRG